MAKLLDTDEVQLFEGNVEIRLENIKKRIDKYFEDLEQAKAMVDAPSESDNNKIS